MAKVKCSKCEKAQDLFDYEIKKELNEAATLTCPTCGTQFELNAVIKEPVKNTDQGPDLGMPSEVPSGPPSVARTAPPAPPTPNQTQPESMKFDTEKLMKQLNEGVLVDAAVAEYLGEEVKGVWSGELAAFNTKLQALAKDIGYQDDLGELVSALQDGGALKINDKDIELNLSKMDDVLRKVVKGEKPSSSDDTEETDDDVDFTGDVLSRDELDMIGAGDENMPSPEKTVSKAVKTYFS